jgi:hypothetical protein
MLGNMLQGREMQYIASKDGTTNTWRILDTWHEALKSLTAEDEIPDDSLAVNILKEGEFIALIKEAARLGVLENAAFGTGEAELEATILNKDQEIQKLNEQILHLQEEKSEVVRNVSSSKEYDLKEQAMASILKLVSMQDMANLAGNKEA